jgi:SAM-dependent methyltransferase
VWLDDDTLSFGRLQILAVFDDRSQTIDSTPERFVLVKSRHMIEWYERTFAAHPPRGVFEIGIFKGGSIALFEELWHPARLVAIDLAREPVVALARYLDETGAATRVRPVYGVDQSDSPAMRSVLDSAFTDNGLDLVVDDGCHQLAEARLAFDTVFPYLRPGGTYVIEDWGWAHWPGVWQQDGGPWRDKPSMTSLALELLMAAASRPDLIESVEVTHELIIVRKGAAVTPTDCFDLGSSYQTAGRRFIELRLDGGGPEVTHALLQTGRTRVARRLRGGLGRSRRVARRIQQRLTRGPVD